MLADKERKIQQGQLQSEFQAVVLESFPYGIRSASLLDRRKFRKIFKEKYLRPFPLAEDNINAFTELAETVCVNVGGKFYSVSQAGLDGLAELLTELRQGGVNTVFFNMLYKKDIPQFTAWGLASPDILAQTIRKYFPCHCGEEHFRFKEDETLEEEVFRVWGGKPRLHLDELSRLMPFVPSQELRKMLLSSSKVLPVGAGDFVLLDAVLFEEEEERSATLAIAEGIREYGFFPGKSLDFHRSQDQNPDVSPLLQAKAFVLLRLFDVCVWRGGIICARDQQLSPDALLRLFCQNSKSFTLEELLRLVDSLFEKRDNYHFLDIARSLAVQVDENHFVDPSAVEFDVPGTDDALALLTDSKPMPLRDVGTFFLLPAVPGYAWNCHLLMSYCRLKSERFQVLRPSPTNACTGIIVDRRLPAKDYYLFAAQIALADNIAMRFEDVANYAFQHGLVARRRNSAITSLLNAMRQLRG